MDHDTPIDEELFFEAWEPGEEDLIEPSPWRRRVIAAVAAVVVVAMALVPAWNLFDRGRPDLASNGLEVCGFDYCVIQEAMSAAGLDLQMARFANTLITDEAASRLAASLVDYLAVEPVEVAVVDSIDGPIAGQYQPDARLIVLERPVRVWTVMHEVAHAASSGHGAGFQEVLIELTVWLGSLEDD